MSIFIGESFDENEWRRRVGLIQRRLNRLILPPFWRAMPLPQGAASLRWARIGVFDKVVVQTVIFDVTVRGGRDWFHLSTAMIDRIPTWEELSAVKDVWLGTEAWACQILPPRSEYVSAHPNVLHLWSPVDGERPLPDFRTEGMI